jgi:hypothetical protein
MDHAARRKHEIRDTMESCRAASGDLNDPQFADLAAALGQDVELRTQFERIQRADVTIHVMFSDVAVPADLAAKISRRLSEVAGARPEGIATLSPALPCPTTVAPLPKRFLRRRFVAGFAAIAASAAVLAAVWLHFHQPTAMLPGRAIDEAMAYFGQDNGPPGELTSIVAPPNDYPISPAIRRLPDVRWRRVEKFLDGEAVAYDLPSQGGKATLYVAHRTVADLPDYPPSGPSGPTMSTGGNFAAAWQSGGMLYVLVVQGDARTYDSYLNRGPLT